MRFVSQCKHCHQILFISLCAKNANTLTIETMFFTQFKSLLHWYTGWVESIRLVKKGESAQKSQLLIFGNFLFTFTVYRLCVYFGTKNMVWNFHRPPPHPRVTKGRLFNEFVVLYKKSSTAKPFTDILM